MCEEQGLSGDVLRREDSAKDGMLARSSRSVTPPSEFQREHRSVMGAEKVHPTDRGSIPKYFSFHLWDHSSKIRFARSHPLKRISLNNLENSTTPFSAIVYSYIDL